VDEATAGLFLKDAFYLLNTNTMELTYVTDIPGYVHTAVTAPNGDIYFASGTVLYKITR
jgi:hypothetical protein